MRIEGYMQRRLADTEAIDMRPFIKMAAGSSSPTKNRSAPAASSGIVKTAASNVNATIVRRGRRRGALILQMPMARHTHQMPGV